MPRYIDIHSHLGDEKLTTDLHEIVGRMREKEVHTITVGCDLQSSKDAVSTADEFPEIFACIGQHPVDNREEKFDIDRYTALASHEKVVAIGECGLDYYRGADEAEKLRQRNLFEAQIAFAIGRDLPLMLHGRPSKGTMDAYEDMLDILKAHANASATLRGNAHFFVGDMDIAGRFLDINFTMSFAGPITFAHEYDDVVRFVPLDMLHAETDSPYAAPVPYRGKRNEPSYVPEVVKAIAAIKNHPEEEVREALVTNAIRTFGL